MKQIICILNVIREILGNPVTDVLKLDHSDTVTIKNGERYEDEKFEQ